MKLSFKQIQEIKKNCPNNCKVIGYKASLVKTCEYCGKLYTPTHHSQKFCTKNCYKKHRQDYKNEWMKTKYKQKPKLGTGYISSGKFCGDFEKEEKIIKNELRRIRR